MAAPIQMTARTLNALKGWPSQSAVDFVAPFSAAALALKNPVSAGSVVYVNSSLQFELGCGTSNVMPLITFQNSDDPDVTMDGGDPATTVGVFVGFSPSGNVTALSCNGAYELVSTNYKTGQTYNPNTPLTSDVAGAYAGMLKPGVINTDMCIGLVSRGIVDNGYGVSAVAFWPEPIFVQ